MDYIKKHIFGFLSRLFGIGVITTTVEPVGWLMNAELNGNLSKYLTEHHISKVNLLPGIIVKS